MKREWIFRRLASSRVGSMGSRGRRHAGLSRGLVCHDKWSCKWANSHAHAHRLSFSLSLISEDRHHYHNPWRWQRALLASERASTNTNTNVNTTRPSRGVSFPVDLLASQPASHPGKLSQICFAASRVTAETPSLVVPSQTRREGATINNSPMLPPSLQGSLSPLFFHRYLDDRKDQETHPFARSPRPTVL